MPPLLGALEAGGTKFVVATGYGDGTVLEHARIQTVGPDDTIREALAWFAGRGQIEALGIASFGPVELDPKSPDYGRIINTSKPTWSDTAITSRFAKALGVPIGLDTDVNGAALAEYRWGALQGRVNGAYIAIGTGVGGGAIVNGRPLYGRRHPEMGHISLPRHPDDGAFKALCPFHDSCAEGLISGPAILRRWGVSLAELPLDDAAHDIIAWYLAQLCLGLVAVLSPTRIVLGGGVMETPGLLARIGPMLERIGGGYFGPDLAALPVAPAHGRQSSVMGALALADHALRVDHARRAAQER